MAAHLPSPYGYSRWQEWVEAYEQYLLTESRAGDLQDPQPVLFAHQLGASGGVPRERASVNGIMMWRPDAKELVISVDGVWVPVANSKTLLEWIAANFVRSAYGGMKLPVSPTAFPDITATPQVIGLGSAYGASRDIAFNGTGQFVFSQPGTYFVSVELDIDHASLAARTAVSMRLFNVTQAIAHLSYPRDAGGTTAVTDSALDYVMIATIPAAEVGDTFQLQVSAAPNNITTVNFDEFQVAIHQVSPMPVPADALGEMLPNFGDYYA